MSLESVQSACVAAVVAAMPDIEFEHENSPFEKPHGAKWGAINFEHAGNEPSTMGDDGFDQDTGFVQVDIRYPLDTGWQDAAEDFDRLRAAWKRGASYTSGGQEVRCGDCVRSRAKREDDCYRLTMTAYWWAEIAR